MMGLSQYISRTELLRQKSTGIAPEIDDATQRRFDEGHRAEELACGLAEAIIGDDLYPVVGTEGKLSASFDGLTLDQSTAWEHKLLNNTLRAVKEAADLPICYRIQMEQCLMLSGAERCLFSATKWDEVQYETPYFIELLDDEWQYYILLEEKHVWYAPDFDLRSQILQGWTQFAIDLENYQHVEHTPVAVAAPTRDLPALSIQVQGSISLIDNLAVFGAQLKTFVAEIDMNPTNDQGFADAEAAVKTLQAAQDALESAEASALAQTSSIDEMRRTVKLYADTARTTRLMLEKMVKARKESIRLEIVQGGKDALAEHVATLNKRLIKVQLPPIPADFAGAIKGKKTIASLRDAVDTELARTKIEANALADKIEINLNSLRKLAKDHAFLFADTPHLVMKANDDFVALIKVRIAEHQQAEAAKAETQRAAIQAEEERKATAKAQAEAEAILAAERAKHAEEEAKTRAKAEAESKAQRVLDDLESETLTQQEAASIEERRKQAQIADQIKPLKLSGAKTAVAQAIAPRRPNRAELLDAVATTFGTTNEAALDWILQEFRGDIQHEERKAA